MRLRRYTFVALLAIWCPAVQAAVKNHARTWTSIATGAFSALDADGQHADMVNCDGYGQLSFTIDITGTITIAIVHSDDGAAPWIELANSSTSADAQYRVDGLPTGFYAPIASSTSGGSAIVKYRCLGLPNN